MPGSTAASSSEQPKAKVTDSSSTNGVFVRPVAVAGIFRPPEESANKPPILPEKRRFSTLSGDLTPCSGAPSDDFARRRQSWDTKNKEIPFGQALLRKTPKNTCSSPLPGKQELATNGSSHEDISRNDTSSPRKSEEKCLEKLNSKSESCASMCTTTADTLSSAKDVSDVSDLSKKGKAQIVSKTTKEESKSVNQSVVKIQSSVSKELTSSVSGTKIATDSVTLNSTSKVFSSVSEKSISKYLLSDTSVTDKVPPSSNSVDCSKQPKKVYGLVKRDSKPETARIRTENSAIKRDSTSEIDSSKTDSALFKKESQSEIASKSDNLPEKIDSTKVKKVYGLNKANLKKDTEIVQNKSTEATVVTKTPENNSVNKPGESNKVSKLQDVKISNKLSDTAKVTKTPENNFVNKPAESNQVNKLQEVKLNSKPSEVAIVTKTRENNFVNKPAESNKVNKLQEVKVSSKLSEAAIVTKTPENNFVNKPAENNKVNKLQEVKLSNKLSEAAIVSKTPENNFVNKPAESKVIKLQEVKVSHKLSEAAVVTKTPENNSVNKPAESSKVNKPQEINISNKASEINVVNKPSETSIVSKESITSVSKITSEGSSVSSKECTISKSSDARPVSGPPKLADKIGEFQKSPSPPKDFRIVRRTSDVIAARIQNIFSNITAPEKPLPIISRKAKTVEKHDTGVDTGLGKTADSKSTNAEKVGAIQITKQSNESQVVDANKNESKLAVESKSEVKNSVAVKCPVTEPEVKTTIKRSDENVNRGESKYKQQNQTSADHSSLKKENKLASESSNVLQSCKAGEVVNTGGVKTELPLKKADSKTEHSINAAPSKAEDKKILNIGGRMPIKKQDQNSLEGTASLKTTNQDDRKSVDSTVPLRTGVETTNKGQLMKTETNNTCAGSVEKNSKSVSSSYTVNTSVSNSANLKNSQNVSKKVEANVSIKEVSSSNSSFVSRTTVKTSSVQQSDSVNTCSNEISQPQVKKVGKFIVENGNVENSTAKLEVAKITPSTVSGIVPTINVLFRTKSPQSAATKEENRKKVVVETYTSTSPIPSAVINASKVSENLSIQSSANASASVKEALKTVENVQKSVSSPSLPKKHAIKNLKKEELAAVPLTSTDSSDTETKMPPNTVKSTDKCSSQSDGNKIDGIKTDRRKEEISDAIKTQMDKSSSRVTTSNSEFTKSAKSQLSATAEPNRISSGIKTETKELSKTGEFDIALQSNDIEKTDLEVGTRFTSKMNVVDLNDWSKKFQRIEPEPPRVPLRRRTARDSMPPSLPVRSRFGSLKRIEDSPRYLPRSPSQSSLPQRYSYTEMLSKVCSMGVLPTVEPSMSKSYSSSSSSQVSELWSELSEEQSTATHTSEMLEAETTERMRLEKEVQELQNRCSQVQIRSDKMEMEMMEARVYRTPELNGDLSEDEEPEGNSSLYRQKYERAIRDMEIMKRRIQQQHEEELEQKDMIKKVSDKRLAEALEDVEEERQVANQWKRKAQKLGSELQDLRLMLEEQMARNGELEKKQRRFDAELSASQEEIKKERLLREKFTREKDQAMHEKYSLEQDLQSAKLDSDTLHEKISQLNRELDELSLSSKGEEEVTQLKRAKQELERKCRDQEEELEELAAQVGMLEQAKLRLEMSLEKVRQEHRREASVREEEIEEIRASFSKKVKNLEAQLESEQDERHQLMKQKHELERRLYEIVDQPPPQDPEIERRLRRDLKRTKALLRDAQSMLEHTREGQSGKTLIRQLKNQLEDSEFAKGAAVKARQAVEAELQECQTQLEEATRAKNEAESRCLQLSREKSAIQTQLEEAEEEMAEVMKKYKAVVAQMSIDQKALSEQNQQIADLETEKQMLKDQLSEVSHKFEHLATQSEDTHKVHRLDGKVRDLESKLELEQTTRTRLEHQIARLKEQNDRAREECDSLRNKELQAQEGVRRLQRQTRELREDYSSLQQKEAEAYRKQHELEMALENTETDLQVTKNDLRLACQRIQDLQNALEDDLDSGTDVPDDSGSDSDESFELAMLRNQSVTPTQRCGSAASNYSLASEGLRNDAEKDFNGFSGVSTSSRLFDVENDETV